MSALTCCKTCSTFLYPLEAFRPVLEGDLQLVSGPMPRGGPDFNHAEIPQREAQILNPRRPKPESLDHTWRVMGT